MNEKEKYQKALRNWEPPFNKSTDQAWDELQPKLSSDTVVVQGFFQKYAGRLAMGAAAAVVLMVVLINLPSASLMQIAALEQQTIQLPDQSTMILNAHSTAKYAERWKDERTVELDGQAFFKVKKGETFTVKTVKGNVEVLGTEFDVFARGSSFRVQCHTGKVKVMAQNTELILLPGQTAELDEKGLVQSTFDVQQPDWRRGEFYFKEEPLANVFAEIERQFNVQLTLPAMDNRYFTGRFSNRSLNEALETVCLPMGLKYTINGNRIQISTP